jgi:hypothetical protein
VPLLYTVNARPGSALSAAALDERCAELLQLVALADKATKLPRDLTQVEMRKLELARAMAAEPEAPDRRRVHGRALAVGSRRHRQPAHPAQRARHHHHPHRAHHARGDEVLAAPGRAGLRQEDRGRPAGRR